MSENKTVFERLDEIDAKLDKAISGKSQSETIQLPRENPQATLKRFISRAKKEYMWLGSREDFEKEKRTTFLFVWVLIGVGLLATIFTSIAFKLYSTFTLFENIWLIMMLCTVKYIHKSQYYHDCFEFSENSFFHFELDADGVLRCGHLKKRYKWFSVITCICAVCNIIVVWMEANNMLALLATIFELALGVLSIYAFYFKVLDYFSGYCQLRFMGRNDSNTQTISIIYDPILNKLYTEEEYKKQFPFCK